MILQNSAESVYVYFWHNFIAFGYIIRCFIIYIFIALPDKARQLQYDFVKIIAFY